MKPPHKCLDCPTLIPAMFPRRLRCPPCVEAHAKVTAAARRAKARTALQAARAAHGRDSGSYAHITYANGREIGSACRTMTLDELKAAWKPTADPLESLALDGSLIAELRRQRRGR